MRRALGLVLSAVGAFLVVVAILLQTWVGSAVMKTPIDVDSTTELAGEATFYGPEGAETSDVLAYSVTHADSEKSDDDVVVFQNSSCLVKDEGGIDGCVSSDDPDDRLVSASTDGFALDRTSAEAINDPAYAESGAVEHHGLVNKWPFEAEKKTYQYWDGLVGGSVDATYDRTEELDGLEAYVYTISIADAPIEISDGVDGEYNDEKEIWIEPLTGAIVNQIDEQERVTTEGAPVISISLAFTDDERAESVEDAKANVSKLNLVTKTLPLIGYVVGIPLLLIGLFLAYRSFRTPTAGARTAREEPASASSA